MGKNIDATFIQSKMLNKSKGPAVHSLRAQADKSDYSRRMRKVMENTENLFVRQAEVTEIMVKDGVIQGVKTLSGAQYFAKAVVLCKMCIRDSLSGETLLCKQVYHYVYTSEWNGYKQTRRICE